MNKTVRHLYEFGPFVLDPGERLVHHGAARMELPPRAFDTLLVLLENTGRLLEKDHLMQTVWGDTVVEENNLSQVIYLLRKALRDGENGSRYIETVPKRGYRFVAEVREIESAEGTNGRRGFSDFHPRMSSASLQNHSSQAPSARENAATEDDLPRSAQAATDVFGSSHRNSGTKLRSVQVLAGGLAVIAVVALLQGANWKQKLFAAEDSRPIRSLAVLPLQNLSNDASQEYFVDGMTDELITDLAQIRELEVVSKTSIMQYKGTCTPLPQIGRDLGVDAVVEGSVLRSGDRVRITAQLIRTATDHHIWAEAYDGDLRDVLSLQARVAEAITSQVKLNLTPEETGRLRRSRPVNPEALDLYLRGRYAWNQRTAASFQRAIQFFNQAIDKDSTFALAYSGLADSYTLLELFGANRSGSEAKAAAEKALQLDDTLAEAHTSLAAVKILQDWDWQGAEREFQRAMELNPNFAQAHHWYGNLLLGPQGRHDEAIAELHRAQQLDPLSLIINADTGFAYYLAGRYDLALEEYQRVLATNPNFLPVHFYLSKYYWHMGQYDLWLKELIEDARLAGFPTQSLRHHYAQGDFRAAMEELAQPVGPGKVPSAADLRSASCTIAESNAALGRSVPALNALETCSSWNRTALIFIKVDPVWSGVRPDPRFQEVLHRLHLQ